MKRDATTRDSLDSLASELHEATMEGDLQANWARVETMTPEEVHRAAMGDPDAQPLTPEQLSRMRRVPNPKRVRESLNQISLERFARLYQLPRGTLMDWEQGHYVPDAASKALLRAIERYPVAVALALNPSLSPREVAFELGVPIPSPVPFRVTSYSSTDTSARSGTDEMDVETSVIRTGAA